MATQNVEMYNIDDYVATSVAQSQKAVTVFGLCRAVNVFTLLRLPGALLPGVEHVVSTGGICGAVSDMSLRYHLLIVESGSISICIE